MSDWIGLGIIALVVLCGLFGLARLSRPYDVTPGEFEKRAQQGPGLLSAGVMGLQKILEPAAKKAAEVQEDLRQGFYEEEEESGEPPDSGGEWGKAGLRTLADKSAKDVAAIALAGKDAQASGAKRYI